MYDQDVVPVARVYAPLSIFTSTFCKLEPDAVPWMAGLPVFTWALFEGDVIDTVGGVVSTVNVIEGVTAMFPALSVALAVMIWDPDERIGVVYDQVVVPLARVYVPLSMLTSTFCRLASDAVP